MLAKSRSRRIESDTPIVGRVSDSSDSPNDDVPTLTNVDAITIIRDVRTALRGSATAVDPLHPVHVDLLDAYYLADELAAAERRALQPVYEPTARDQVAIRRAEQRLDRNGRCPFTYVESTGGAS